jgi:hypothetical protein
MGIIDTLYAPIAGGERSVSREKQSRKRWMGNVGERAERVTFEQSLSGERAIWISERRVLSAKRMIHAKAGRCLEEAKEIESNDAAVAQACNLAPQEAEIRRIVVGSTMS